MRTIRIQPDLNKFLILEQNKKENLQIQEQQNTFVINERRSFTPKQQTELDQYVYLKNIEKFITLLDGNNGATHCYDDITQFAKVPVLSQGWAYATDARFKTMSWTPTRDQCIEMTSRISKFDLIFKAIGFIKIAPLLFDRNWNIIDGYHRFMACKSTETRFFFMRLDF